MIKALIIDDEKKAVSVMQMLLQKHVPEISEIHISIGAEAGLHTIQALSPDLIFMDIEMPLMSGFNILEKFPQYNFEVIFTTAYDHYAIKAIRYSALDYLLKPINYVELKNAVQRFFEKQRLKIDTKARYDNLLHNLRTEHEDAYRLAVSTTEGTHFYDPQEIVRCEADDNYTRIFFVNKKPIITSRTLKEYDELLSAQGFYRIHRTHLINKKFIESFMNDHTLQMKDGSKVEVSRRKWDDIKKILLQP